MKKLLKNLFMMLAGTLLLAQIGFAAPTNSSCYSTAEFQDFKTLYIKLQQELNYENTDAYLDKNFKVQVKAHDPGTPYGGKIFEDALFAEYQNSLRKIARLYQSAKHEGNDNFKSNETLVKFMQAIDGKSADSDAFINQAKVQDVLAALQEASIKKYGTNDKKNVLNAGDKYLLEKLLTHSQDRICSVNAYIKTNKGTMYFRPDYLQKVKNAPLNRLINSISTASIKKDSQIDSSETSALIAPLIDPTVAVKSAIIDNLNQLSSWIKTVKARGDKCMATLKAQPFLNSLQNDIQICNFGHFIESLSRDNVDNLESVLHFINANEKFLNKPQALAETDLNENRLEGFIGDTFKNLGLKIRCTILDSALSANGKKIFISNLPYDKDTNKFDTSSIVCKSDGQDMDSAVCSKQYELVADSEGLGRGLEIKPKKGTPAKVKFSVKGNPECSDLELDDGKACREKKEIGFIFTWDDQKKECIKTPEVDPKAECLKQVEEGFSFTWNEEKKECIKNVVDEKKKCEEQVKEGFTFKWDAEKKVCSEIPNVVENKCEKGFSWDEEKKECTNPKMDECLKKNEEFLNWRWDEDKQECKELDPSKKEEEGGIAEAEPVQKIKFQPKQPPGRFQKVKIPIRGPSVTGPMQ